MSDYLESLEEMKIIDNYLTKEDHTIINVYENLSGMFIEFENKVEIIKLQLVTTEGRKYLSAKLQEVIGLSETFK